VGGSKTPVYWYYVKDAFEQCFEVPDNGWNSKIPAVAAAFRVSQPAIA
jgi:hypothetical protein